MTARPGTAAARDAVVADAEDGLRLGVSKTPTFLVGHNLLAGGIAQDQQWLSGTPSRVETKARRRQIKGDD